MSRNSYGGGGERRFALGRGGMQIVVGDLAQAEGEIADEMHGRDDLKREEFGKARERGRDQGKRRGACPRALERDVVKEIFDELPNSRGSFHIRNDLEQKVRRRQ